MIVVLKSHASDAEVEEAIRNVRDLGYEPHVIRGVVQTVVAAVGDEATHASLESLTHLPMVENVMPVQRRYKLISREAHPESSIVRIGEVQQGRTHLRINRFSQPTCDPRMLLPVCHAVPPIPRITSNTRVGTRLRLIDAAISDRSRPACPFNVAKTS